MAGVVLVHVAAELFQGWHLSVWCLHGGMSSLQPTELICTHEVFLVASENFESLIGLILSLRFKLLLFKVAGVWLLPRRSPLQRSTDKWGLFLGLNNQLRTFLETLFFESRRLIIMLSDDFLWVRNKLLRF